VMILHAGPQVTTPPSRFHATTTRAIGSNSTISLVTVAFCNRSSRRSC
jgi:hypothetical protein